ncbi:hypothetical protein SAE02_77240 [Skermanella aerolata]|uniref:Uncharacterized protein n=1 Tax=Skermanella aerolata TaxID=393310 RepID=A0A512E4A7_9PROT|nr:hypothetical protein SAE02_77240 [Skermanella aerolata]
MVEIGPEAQAAQLAALLNRLQADLGNHAAWQKIYGKSELTPKLIESGCPLLYRHNHEQRSKHF